METTSHAQVETVRLLSGFFSAAQQGANLSAMLAESDSGAFLATSTLRLLCVVTSERSTKVENLVPQICTLALDEIAPCAQQEAHMADLLPPFLHFTQVSPRYVQILILILIKQHYSPDILHAAPQTMFEHQFKAFVAKQQGSVGLANLNFASSGGGGGGLGVKPTSPMGPVALAAQAAASPSMFRLERVDFHPNLLPRHAIVHLGLHDRHINGFDFDRDGAETLFRRFMQMLAAIIEVETMPPSIVREALSVFDHLNQKHNIFNLGVFKTELTAQLLRVLMQALLSHTHAMLEDEMHRLLYALAMSDMQGFFYSFLPTLVAPQLTVGQGSALTIPPALNQPTALGHYLSRHLGPPIPTSERSHATQGTSWTTYALRAKAGRECI